MVQSSTVQYDLVEHRHRFAAWAAARATQRGFTTVARLRTALEVAGVRESLADGATVGVSAAGFDALHRRWCTSISATLETASVPGVTFGRAAKLVAVYLKAQVVMGPGWDTPLAHHLHPPIDRILLQALATSPRIASPHKAQWRATSWTQLDEAGYYELIGQLRSSRPSEAPFWMLEELWQPSEPGDEG